MLRAFTRTCSLHLVALALLLPQCRFDEPSTSDSSMETDSESGSSESEASDGTEAGDTDGSESHTSDTDTSGETETSDSDTSGQSDTSDETSSELDASYYDSGPVRLDYNHDLNINSQGFTMHLAVQGPVSIEHYQNAVGKLWCPASAGDAEHVDAAVFRLRGEGTVPISGTVAVNMGDSSCDCTFTSQIDVSIEGVRHFKPNDYQCSDEVFNLQLNETWYTNNDADCDCVAPDPDDEVALETQWNSVLRSMPENSPEDHADMTLEYRLCDGMKITQPFEGEGGSGTYQWIFNLWSQGDYTYTPGHPLAYDDELSPGGQIVCADTEGAIGPPLSSIALDVENGEWFDYPE